MRPSRPRIFAHADNLLPKHLSRCARTCHGLSAGSAASRFAWLLPLVATLATEAAEKQPERVPESVPEISKWIAAAEARLEALPRLIACEQSHGRIGFYGRHTGDDWIAIDLGSTVAPDEVVLFPARLPTDTGGVDEAFGFPLEMDLEISESPTFEPSVRFARWSAPSDGTAERERAEAEPSLLRFPGIGASGRYLRVRIGDAPSRPTGSGRFFTLGEIVVLSKGRNTALGRLVEASSEQSNPPRWQAENLTDGYLWCLPLRGAEASSTNGYHSAIENRERGPAKWVEVDLGSESEIDEIHLVPARPRDFPDAAGFGFPPRFRVVGFPAGAGAEGRMIYEAPSEAPAGPGSATAMLPAGDQKFLRLRVECEDLWQRSGDFIFALAELQAWSGGRNLAAGRPVAAADGIEQGRWSLAALTDGYSSRRSLLPWSEWLDAVSERIALEEESALLASALAQGRERAQRRLLGILFAAATALACAALATVVAQRRRSASAERTLRERIASDLHDELGARLCQIAIQCDLAAAEVPPGNPAASRLSGLSDTARNSVGDMRDIVWLLSPANHDREGLAARLEGIAARLLEGVPHAFRSEGDPPPDLPVACERELVLFLKEALANARRHAPGAAVEVSMVWRSECFLVAVSDKGRGFDPLGVTRGRGLHNLAERAKTLGGECRIDAAPGRGTRVVLEAPLPGTKRKRRI